MAGALGLGTTTPAATLEVNGTAKFDNTVTFSAGQVFPGTITGVIAGTDLTGGGAGGTVTLNVDTTKVPQLSTPNTFLGNQTISNGNLDLPLTSSSTVGVITMGGTPLIQTCCGGAGNLFLGDSAGNFTGTGGSNIAIGLLAMQSNTTGSSNTALGQYALESTTSGHDNTTVGYGALELNTTGAFNTALGENALLQNTTAGENTALGRDALQQNTTGSSNTAVGHSSLGQNTTGGYNTAVGVDAGTNNLTGSNNTFVGMSAGPSIDGLTFATAIGYGAAVGQSNAMVLGARYSNGVDVGINTPTPGAVLDIDSELNASQKLLTGRIGANSEPVFRVDNTGKGYFDGGTQTNGADFAESIAVRGKRSQYEPGDLLVIDPAGRRRLALASTPYSTRVAGIFSTKPGVLATPHAIADSASRDEVPLAVVGIVPCKVTTINGSIQVGDLLVTSSRAGYAMKGVDRRRMLGAVVGKALEPLNQRIGVIQVLVTLQ